MKPDPKAAVNLEDLLKLKRTERPPEAFWAQFEQELRAKQLAAIVERRSSWTAFARTWGLIRRYPLPLGATAVLAFTFVGARQLGYTRVLHPDRTGGDRNSALAEPVSRPAPLAATVAIPSPQAAVVPSGLSENNPVAAPLAAASASAPAFQALAISRPSTNAPVGAPPPTDARLSSAVRVYAAEDSVSSGAESSRLAENVAAIASTRSIQVDLAALQPIDPPEGSRFLGATRVFSVSATSVRPAAMSEPLASMNPISDERRSRLLATSLPAVAASGDTAIGAPNDRLVSQLSDDRLYESISRYGVGGNRFSIKF